MQLFGSGQEILEAGRQRRSVRAFDPFEGPMAAAMIRGGSAFVVYRIDGHDEELSEADRSALMTATLFVASGPAAVEQGRTQLEQLVERYPESPAVLGMWGQLLSSSLKFEEAFEAFDRAAERAPREPGILAARQQCEKRRDDFDEALRYPEILIPGNETLANDMVSRAVVLMTHDRDAAGRLARAVVEHTDNTPLRTRAMVLSRLLAAAPENASADGGAPVADQPTLASNPGAPSRTRAADPTVAPDSSGGTDDGAAESDSESSSKLEQNLARLALLGTLLGSKASPENEDSADDPTEKSQSETAALLDGLLTVMGVKPAGIHVRTAVEATKRGMWSDALESYHRALEHEPENFTANNNLAWLLATCPDDAIRDGSRAVEVATAACRVSKWQDCTGLDTLAAALAECGRFEQAVQRQREAIELLPDGDTDRAAKYEESLECYLRREPFREEPPATAPESASVPAAPVATTPSDPLGHPVVARSGYPRDAFAFLYRGLRRAQETFSTADDTSQHVTGADLCRSLRDQAIEEFGADARERLASWNVHRTGDFGTMVWTLVEAGLMTATEDDRREQFDDVYDFAEAFDEQPPG